MAPKFIYLGSQTVKTINLKASNEVESEYMGMGFLNYTDLPRSLRNHMHVKAKRRDGQIAQGFF